MAAQNDAPKGAEALPAQRPADRPEGARKVEEQAREDGRVVSPAGPHAKPSLTDNEKTPGAGTLPETTANESDPGAG
ncbi:hypothetical protein GCM10007036_38630 [Alsobacter metallidurans]|uniref:Uncharacterized protein n=1 Tax=Alsobacter metallidurans TaxID=340221 RepID=A0A917I9E9_9HYPH|nr:hypothetical protein [Alsobacter metallidurans]GGH29014.1 hypothetical protein GCM10007036_38630 [Alsobacter metallidurans]